MYPVGSTYSPYTFPGITVHVQSSIKTTNNTHNRLSYTVNVQWCIVYFKIHTDVCSMPWNVSENISIPTILTGVHLANRDTYITRACIIYQKVKATNTGNRSIPGRGQVHYTALINSIL